MTGFETQVINELAVLKLYRAVSKTPHLNVIPSLAFTILIWRELARAQTELNRLETLVETRT